MLPARLADAIRHGGVRNPDDRGLMPLAEARAVVRGARAFVKGEGELQDGVGNVLASDVVWAALLSLEDGAEFVAEASRLDWQFHPRGMDNVDLHLRYGDAIVPWLATRLDATTGELHNVPWCVWPCLLASDGDAAFDLAWRTTSPLLASWLDRHPETGAACLRARPERRAAAHLRGLALRGKIALPATPPTEELVLGWLAACALRLAPGNVVAWPAAGGAGASRAHGFRAIAARDGDDWGLAIERVEGEKPSGVHAARIAVFGFGSRLPRGFAIATRPLAVTAPHRAGFADWLADQTVRDPDRVLGPPSRALATLQLAGARIVAVVPSLSHDGGTPSDSPVYAAIAKAIAAP